ncbi:HesA/MoeB/ThiF family protein [Anaeromyxobacter terrae]|uniref:HesA/MoeB/ThiF family protein n=1 Tax=Anaeromyxobacter terrae TaxID=2925406 RepID=UPI001F569FB2|nr:ThiF family adenylyltransferase [Anaeromyxobacter sp. SG22]
MNDERLERYARQLLVPGFGEAAQERLGRARVRVVGADAVASAGLVYLVQAGVGRLWIEDPEDVSPGDVTGWLFAPSAVGTPRVEAARAVLAPLSRFVSIEPYPTGGVPSATLVFASSAPQALASAEAARRAGIPHVVVEPDAEGGALVVVPPGAPCYACARSTTGVGRPAQPGIAALSALAAEELVLMISNPGSIPGRRIDLVRGVATARPTSRLAGCACGGAPAASAS